MFKKYIKIDNHTSNDFITKAKYKDKYYECLILRKGKEKSKIKFKNCNYVCYIKNEDIIYE